MSSPIPRSPRHGRPVTPISCGLRPGLPALTYKQVFTRRPAPTLIDQALVNNRDLCSAAANIAAAREQYRIQRADQLPQFNASGGVTLSGDKDNSVKADYQAGLQVSRALSSTSSAGCAR